MHDAEVDDVHRGSRVRDVRECGVGRRPDEVQLPWGYRGGVLLEDGRVHREEHLRQRDRSGHVAVEGRERSIVDRVHAGLVVLRLFSVGEPRYGLRVLRSAGRGLRGLEERPGGHAQGDGGNRKYRDRRHRPRVDLQEGAGLRPQPLDRHLQRRSDSCLLRGIVPGCGGHGVHRGERGLGR